ncbi:uncharacterized protein LOC127480460 [Manacus candei]|uniref:uncharacterized protein LOC127480460 n=1 Tax=Manacus candei TaxID=415023 RepID=UPI0022264A8E|nr:uncharacterized protein LOC127480460 [Manacus candei]
MPAGALGGAAAGSLGWLQLQSSVSHSSIPSSSLSRVSIPSSSIFHYPIPSSSLSRSSMPSSTVPHVSITSSSLSHISILSSSIFQGPIPSSSLSYISIPSSLSHSSIPSSSLSHISISSSSISHVSTPFSSISHSSIPSSSIFQGPIPSSSLSHVSIPSFPISSGSSPSPAASGTSSTTVPCQGQPFAIAPGAPGAWKKNFTQRRAGEALGLCVRALKEVPSYQKVFQEKSAVAAQEVQVLPGDLLGLLCKLWKLFSCFLCHCRGFKKPSHVFCRKDLHMLQQRQEKEIQRDSSSPSFHPAISRLQFQYSVVKRL